MRFNLTIISLLLSTSLCFAQFRKATFQIDGATLQYQISFPKDYDKTKKYPLLIFLHGGGEKGSDNEKQLTHGKDFLLENTQEKFPAIVIAPQCPESSYWANVRRHSIGEEITFSFGVSDKPTAAMEILIPLINDWLWSGKIDLSRVYIGGLSMGGMGTFELLWRMPNTFAAAFPVCGGADFEKAKLYAKNTAVWIFHGEMDPVVPVINSKRMYLVLQNLGCDVKYTEYAGVNHNSWDNAFKEDELFPWLFEHTK